MRVIVAGPPKTGTTSVAAALRLLGYTVYDCDEQVDLQLDDWHKILVSGEDPSLHFPRMFESVDALTDGPGYYFWEQLLEAFPNAKVILLTREEDSWAPSYEFQKAVEWRNRWLARFDTKLRKVFQVVDAAERLSMGSDKFVDYMYRWKFRLHNDRVRAVVPSEQLLEFGVKDGWQPLCEFLGNDVPEVQFPHANQSAEDFEAEFRRMRNGLIKGLAIKSAVAVGVVGVLSVLFRRTSWWAR